MRRNGRFTRRNMERKVAAERIKRKRNNVTVTLVGSRKLVEPIAYSSMILRGCAAD
jgi:hypothetical protein